MIIMKGGMNVKNMSKKEFKPFSWLVTRYDCNANKIINYNVLKYGEDFIKSLKKKCEIREEFAEKLRREMCYCYWSKAEHELIISIEDDKVFLTPWCGCRNPEEVRIDVTNETDFSWREFAELHIDRQVYDNKAKVDIYDQIMFRFDEFLDYVINYKHRYQREDYSVKFAKR